MVATASLQTTTAARKPANSAAEKGALVHFIMAEFRTTKALASRIVNAAYSAGARYQLSPSLVLAIISRESTFNPQATSGYGAQGLMQVVPRFHMDKLQGSRVASARASLFHPETNIDVGTRILAEYIEQASGLHAALVKYSGRAPRYVEKVLQAHQTFERVRQAAGEEINGTA
ncbi:transglycosylase SLT domain-containing protein [Azohydromonas australica]|uniref:transglycosylase SLT domain-containing protein n=1 Tax=Azohydromonas australica TaxID=364039 RepID=UPI000424BADB|nr:transglycosylase SLT domain-containing protein [Azohydromonas australica]